MMARRPLLLLTLVLLAAAAGPAVPAGAQEEAPSPVAPQIADGSAQAALDKARARWKAARIGSYRFQARRRCFCPGTGWHVVNVRRGVLSGTVHRDVKDVATVPRLFRTIQRAIDRRVHGLVVTYGARGVPTQIDIDSFENVIDEEQYFSIRGFKRL